jgi:ribosomal protein S18 acetylase RimI-like enzyme
VLWDLVRVSFLPARPDDALSFCARSPASDFDEPLRRRLLTSLTSSPDGTFVLADDSGLALVATTIDRIADATAPAQLVLLGARPDFPRAAFIERVVEPASAFARGQGRPGLVVAGSPFIEPLIEDLTRAGFVHVYDILTMVRRRGIGLDGPGVPSPEGFSWATVDAATVAAAHAALVEIFRNAPATTLPPLEEFRTSAVAAEPPWQALLDGSSIAGLVRLAVNESVGEIRVLGRRPTLRGRGLGRVILDHALRVLAALDVGEVRLEVDGANTAAVALYQSFAFEITARTPWYRLDVSNG